MNTINRGSVLRKKAMTSMSRPDIDQSIGASQMLDEPATYDHTATLLDHQITYEPRSAEEFLKSAISERNIAHERQVLLKRLRELEVAEKMQNYKKSISMEARPPRLPSLTQSFKDQYNLKNWPQNSNPHQQNIHSNPTDSNIESGSSNHDIFSSQESSNNKNKLGISPSQNRANTLPLGHMTLATGASFKRIESNTSDFSHVTCDTFLPENLQKIEDLLVETNKLKRKYYDLITGNQPRNTICLDTYQTTLPKHLENNHQTNMRLSQPISNLEHLKLVTGETINYDHYDQIDHQVELDHPQDLGRAGSTKTIYTAQNQTSKLLTNVTPLPGQANKNSLKFTQHTGGLILIRPKDRRIGVFEF